MPQDSTQQGDNMKNWFAEKIIDFADCLFSIGNNLRDIEYDTFCDVNPDCLCDDPDCIDIRNSL
jgi:hypothetical protein